MILTDNSMGGIVALDLDNCNMQWRDLDWKKSSSTIQLWCVSLNDWGLCGVKYRYSSYYKKYVVLATASSGKVYAVDYQTKQRLWYVNDRKDNNRDISLYNAHSIEMLPNGDIIVATSGYAEGSAYYENGGLHYYPAGSTTRSDFLSLPFAHAVLWDPSNECLWSIGFEGIVAVKVTGSGRNASMTKIPGKSLKLSNFTGHDMVPAFGMDGKFWVADNSNVYLFDSATKTLTKDITYTASGVKGIAYFEDGTMLHSTWNKSFALYWSAAATNYRIQRSVLSTSNKFYKVHTMTDKYE